MKMKFYLLPVLAFIIFTATSCPEEDGDVYLVNIEVVNLDNSGEDAYISEEPVNRNAFVIGVNYLVGYTPPNEKKPFSFNKKFSYDNIVILNFPDNPTIICNEDFDEDHPANSDVTKFFKISTHNDRDYDMLLLLMEPPVTGTYSFRVVFNCPNNVVIKKETEPVTLF